MRGLSSSFCDLFVLQTRPGKHYRLGGLRRAVGVYVRGRSTTLHLLPVTSERRQLAIFSSLKSQALLWSKGNNILGFPFSERGLHKHRDLRSLGQGKKQ